MKSLSLPTRLATPWRLKNMYVIQPEYRWWGQNNWIEGEPLPEGFSLTSENNDRSMTPEELMQIVGEEIDGENSAFNWKRNRSRAFSPTGDTRLTTTTLSR